MWHGITNLKGKRHARGGVQRAMFQMDELLSSVSSIELRQRMEGKPGLLSDEDEVGINSMI